MKRTRIRENDRSPDRWLSVEEVGEYLGVSRDTVYRWVRDRQLPGRSVGRLWKFKKDDIDRWVEAGGENRDAARGTNGEEPLADQETS